MELQAAFGFQTFGLSHYRAAVPWLGSYPRQNSLAVAFRELGRIERSLFIPD